MFLESSLGASQSNISFEQRLSGLALPMLVANPFGGGVDH
jgi:hypothetical protein